MFPLTAPIAPHDMRVAELVGVSRFTTTPPDLLPLSLTALVAGEPADLGDRGRLRFTSPFTSTPNARRWHARARLEWGGIGIVRHARVEVEVLPWSLHGSELRIRPVARSPHAWGVRRLRRYLGLSVRAADELARLLAHASRRAPISRPTLAPALITQAAATECKAPCCADDNRAA